jgi:hypothetical protein
VLGSVKSGRLIGACAGQCGAESLRDHTSSSDALRGRSAGYVPCPLGHGLPPETIGHLQVQMVRPKVRRDPEGKLGDGGGRHQKEVTLGE